ncbi:MAG: hypothetical protein HC900_01615 [Methylacidiphilales bacterium]|nr:hypothetical protein [Candidatus Methylacidiphilales bacterium]
MLPDDLWFSRSGDDLVIQIVGASDRITVAGWFASDWAQLQTVKVGAGLQIGAAEINSIVAALQTYQDFDPTTAQNLPTGVSLSPHFSDGPIVGGVPSAPNVALATKLAFEEARPEQQALIMQTTAELLVVGQQELSSAIDYAGSATLWEKPLPSNPRLIARHFLYMANNDPYQELYFGTIYKKTGQTNSDIPSNWSSYSEIHSLDTSIYYIDRTLTKTGGAPRGFPMRPAGWFTATLVGDPNLMAASCSDLSRVYGLLVEATSFADRTADMSLKKQAALSDAVEANDDHASFGSSQASRARDTATAAESAFVDSVAQYVTLASTVRNTYLIFTK